MFKLLQQSVQIIPFCEKMTKYIISTETETAEGMEEK